MKTMTNVQRALTKAKMRLRSWAPYLTHIFAMMRTVETTEVDTMAVDQANRLYCNPQFMDSLTPQEIAYCLLHEVMHVVLSHCRRFAMVAPQHTERERFCWNVAADLVIQQMLARHYDAHEPQGIIRIDGLVPCEGQKIRFVDVPGLNAGMTVEQYYGLLLPLMPEQPPQDDGNPLDPAKAGSNSDGTQREYEQPTSGIEQAMVEHALRQAEEKIEKYEAQHPGSVPGELRKAIAARLRPQPDPFDELRRVVARSVASPLGAEEYTYRRVNRRQREEQPRRRGYIRMAPECSIIIDTSGSMEGSEQRALTAIAQGLRRVQRPRVIAYDTEVRSAQRLTSLSDFAFVGYGGTDMTAALEQEDKEQHPDAIVLVTDGETEWPAKPTRARLIVALVRGKPGYSTPPKWATVIDLTREVNTYAG